MSGLTRITQHHIPEDGILRRHYHPEDGILRSHHHENIKSYKMCHLKIINGASIKYTVKNCVQNINAFVVRELSP
jgi:hypothetical protein